MATSPTSKSALLSGAAKDDAVGLNGDFTFTIADLLANDPGGAAKVSAGTQFFFGDTAADQADQVTYLATHGIIDNGDGSYTLTADATDFKYFVQIGNKGTWSQADVEVTAPEPTPEPHKGDFLFGENFDGIEGNVIPASGSFWQPVDLAVHGWTGATGVELGANGYLTIPTTSGDGNQAFWLDSQKSPGPIDISHEFTDLTAAVDGKTAVLSFDIAKQSFDGHTTSANATLEVRIDNVAVATIAAADLANFNEMYHYEIGITGYAEMGDDIHTLSLVDTTNEFVFNGFSVDSIQINDWVI